MMDPFRAGFCTFQQLVSHYDNYPLLDYAVSQWAFHTTAALVNDSSGTSSEPGTSPLLERILNFLETQKGLHGGSFALWLQCLVPDASPATIMTKPLYYAASFGIVPAVKALLLSADTNINAKGDRNTSSALVVATYRGHADVVKLLLEANADVNSTDIFGLTSLHWAKRRRRDEIAELLRKHGASEVSA
jgi:hypothetical protein